MRVWKAGSVVFEYSILQLQNYQSTERCSFFYAAVIRHPPTVNQWALSLKLLFVFLHQIRFYAKKTWLPDFVGGCCTQLFPSEKLCPMLDLHTLCAADGRKAR